MLRVCTEIVLCITGSVSVTCAVRVGARAGSACSAIQANETGEGRGSTSRPGISQRKSRGCGQAVAKKEKTNNFDTLCLIPASPRLDTHGPPRWPSG